MKFDDSVETLRTMTCDIDIGFSCFLLCSPVAAATYVNFFLVSACLFLPHHYSNLFTPGKVAPDL